MLEKLKKLKVNIGWKSIVLIGVCVALVLVDLLTKIFEERDGWNFIVIRNFLEVASGSRNPGCAFSFLAEATWGQIFLIVVTFIMLILLVGFFIVLPERFIILKVAVAMVAAGAIGNLIDRIAYREVRDFVELNMFGNMTSCNFADFWIVLGAVLAVVDLLFLNEWAVFPLTKSAKAAQAKRKEEEEAKKQAVATSEVPQEEDKQTEVKDEHPEDENKQDNEENG
ncbi:MAG: signal peptidase II [Clostridia bacterium]|nr:signal peptidase II [Clostridia bacterium]